MGVETQYILAGYKFLITRLLEVFFWQKHEKYISVLTMNGNNYSFKSILETYCLF